MIVYSLSKLKMAFKYSCVVLLLYAVLSAHGKYLKSKPQNGNVTFYIIIRFSMYFYLIKGFHYIFFKTMFVQQMIGIVNLFVW